MKRFLILVLPFLVSCVQLAAQKLPSWSKNASNSVCKVITYDSAGMLKKSGNGVFISATGECVTDFGILSDADSLIVMTRDGKKHPLLYVNGYDDIYDIAHFTVDIKKSSFLSSTLQFPEVGSEVYAILYSNSKTPSLIKGTVNEISDARDGDKYFTLSIELPESAKSCPVVNDKGQLIGIVQLSETEGEAYACGTKMTASMNFDAFMFTNKNASSIHLLKKLPPSENDAQVAIMMGASSLSDKRYVEYLNQYMASFPKSPYSYEALANYFVGTDREQAVRYIEIGSRLYSKKDEQNYSVAKFIISNNDLLNGFDGYDMEKAYSEINDAIETNPLPLYYQLKGEIEMAEQKYEMARCSMDSVLNSNMCTPQAVMDYVTINEKLGADSKSQIELIDSLLETKKNILGADTLNMIYAKALYLDDDAQYAEALRYLNIYSAAFGENMTPEFFYYREQVAMRGRRYQQAMDDIVKACKLAPDNMVYKTEHAGLCIIAGEYDKAIDILMDCLKAEPDNADINRLTGLALLQTDRKDEACAYLQKACDSGDPTAKRLVEMYCTGLN